MKILKIFGIVVAVHAAVFIFIFAIPGCRSTGNTNSPAANTDTPPGSATVNYAETGNAPITPAPTSGNSAARDLNPALVPAGNSVSFDPTIPAGSVRFAPTRPGAAPANPSAPQNAAGPDVAPSRTYTVVKGDSLWTVAKKHGVTISELANANNLKAGSTLRLDQKLIIPGKAPAGAGSSTAAAPNANAAQGGDNQTYTVKAGDTLAVIARRHGSTAATLKAMNNLKTDIVRPGQVLALPVSSGASASAAPVDTATPPTVTKAPRSSGAVAHIVKPGETLGSIAKKYQVQVGEIAAANNISDPAKIRPGQELMVPGWQASGARASKPAPAAGPAATPPPPALSRTPPVEQTNQPQIPLFSVPPPDQDLDAGLKKSAEEVPVIKVEDSGAPKIE